MTKIKIVKKKFKKCMTNIKVVKKKLKIRSYKKSRLSRKKTQQRYNKNQGCLKSN